MIKKRYFLYGLLATSAMVHAEQVDPAQARGDREQSIDVLFSNETLEARYFRDVGLIGTGPQKFLLGGYLNTDNSFQFTGGLATEVLEDFTPLKSNLKFSLGSRLYISRLADPSNNVFGLGFGGGWDFRFPQEIIKLPLTLRGSYYFSPEVLTSGSDQDILDFDILEAQLDLTKNLKGIFGLREMSVADRSLDNNWHLGIRYKFD